MEQLDCFAEKSRRQLAIKIILMVREWIDAAGQH